MPLAYGHQYEDASGQANNGMETYLIDKLP